MRNNCFYEKAIQCSFYIINHPTWGRWPNSISVNANSHLFFLPVSKIEQQFVQRSINQSNSLKNAWMFMHVICQLRQSSENCCKRVTIAQQIILVQFRKVLQNHPGFYRKPQYWAKAIKFWAFPYCCFKRLFITTQLYENKFEIFNVFH